jgi:DNA-binding CsgD family transcriptional regulator
VPAPGRRPHRRAREIAAHLVISPLTARTHVLRAMTKLHARDRVQLVVIAYQTGLVVTGGTT